MMETQFARYAMTIFTNFEDFLANIHFIRKFIHKKVNVYFNGLYRILKKAVLFVDRNLVKIILNKIYKIQT